MSSYSLEETIRQLQTSPKPEERLFAAFRLGRDRDPRVVAPLIAALHDPDAAVRTRAAEALGTRTEAQVVPALIAMLQDEEIEVRRVAIQSLGRIGHESALDDLLTMLHDDDASLRAQAAEALGNFPDHLTAAALVKAFIEDADTQVQTSARQSIAHAGNQSAALALLAHVPAAQNDTPLLVDMLEVLGLIADRAALDAVLPLQDHADETVRAMAAWAVQQMGAGND